jgi:hypothetical protein
MLSKLPLNLDNVRRTLCALFNKPLDPMGFDNWKAIIDPSLSQPIDHFLHYFSQAASVSDETGVLLDRLSVVMLWLNKHPDPPEHEYIIIQTEDAQDGMSRLFILERMISKSDCELQDTTGTGTTTKKDSKRPDTGSYQLVQGITNYILPPSRPAITPLSSMEEGTLTSTSTPVSFLAPQHSIPDTLSLSATKTSQMVSDSFDKGDKKAALDRILGSNVILQRRYGLGQNARQIKPNNLKLFELMVLAQAVHEFAPHYSQFHRNCYWFGNMIIDAVTEICPGSWTSPGDEDGGNIYKKSLISGRWNGLKVSDTEREELSMIVGAYKKARTKAISEVKFFFF